jgi:hypothetical protein
MQAWGACTRSKGADSITVQQQGRLLLLETMREAVLHVREAEARAHAAPDDSMHCFPSTALLWGRLQCRYHYCLARNHSGGLLIRWMHAMETRSM